MHVNNPQQPVSYQQFQQQLDENRKTQMQQAQAAIAKTGADNFSNQVRQIVVKLQNLQDELQQSQNQLETQMDASRRQLQRNKDAIAQIENDLSKISIQSAGMNGIQ